MSHLRYDRILDDDEEENSELVWRGISSNDPGVTKLKMGHGCVLPHDWAWARGGKWIGDNTHLKELHLCTLQDYEEPTEAELASFFRGVGLNRSVREIHFHYCRLLGGGAFHQLASLFENNREIECIQVEGCVFEHRSAHHLPAALAKFGSLRKFVLSSCHRLGDRELTDILRALRGHPQLKSLRLCGIFFRRESGCALSALVGNVNSELVSLDLYRSHINHETAALVATAMEENRSIEHLNMGSIVGISPSGWRAIFDVLRNPRTNILQLDLYHNPFADATMTYLADSLTFNRSLKILDLSCSNQNITAIGWKDFFSLLQSPHCMLEEINLGNNNFSDVEVKSLVHSLPRNTLRSLQLFNNPRITVIGWKAVSTVIRSPGSSLEELVVYGNRIPGEAAIDLAESLASNSTMIKLDIDNYFDEPEGVWPAFSRALCDDSSISATYTSNHTLQQVSLTDEEGLIPDALKEILRINKQCGKSQAAREKIILVHFIGAFKMKPFIGLDLNLVPYAVAWLAKCDTDYNERHHTLIGHLYCFLRSFASLFDFEGRVFDGHKD